MLIPLCRRRTDRPPLAPAAPATGLSAGRCQAVLDAMDVGVLVCDEHARLVHANAAGEQALAQSALLCLVERRLSTPQHAQQALLLQAIRAATCGRHQLLKLQFGALRLSLSVQPLDVADGEARQALLLLGRRCATQGLGVALLCQLHDLTSAEQRVLTGLLQGQRVSQLATQHGVKVSTVRTQVAALRAKLGVSRMDEALLMAAELPPMVSALRRRQPCAPEAMMA